MALLPQRTKKQKAQDKKTERKDKAEREKNDKSSPNTGPIYYLSNKTVAKACEDETKKIRQTCDKDKVDSQLQAKNAKAANSTLGKATQRVKSALDSLEAPVKKAYGYTRNKTNGWVEDHCNGLWIKPMGGKGQKEFEKFTKSLEDIKKNIENEINDGLMKAGKVLAEQAKQQGINYLEKAAVREGAALASLVIPVVGEVVVVGATVWNVLDGIWTAGTVMVKAVGVGKIALEKYNELKPQLQTLEDMLSKKITSSTVLADMMTAAAIANPCIQARRCILIPYEETEGKKIDKVSAPSGAVQARSGEGCCPGQTGHHVLPEAMFGKDGGPCKKPYKHSKGLIICVEGTGNQVGSHGVAHRALEKTIDDYKRTGATTISYGEASKQGIAAVRKLNPACSKICLQAQLDAHYKDELGCENAQLIPHAGMGGEATEVLPGKSGNP